MPLIPGCEAELAADAETLLSTGVCTDIACQMTLVPESDPAENKAKILGDHFETFRNVFKGDPSRVGILAQATIGHGWTPDEPAPYQKITRPDGGVVYQMCPLDPAFQTYIRDAFRHLARLKPAFFMIDDDFRLLTSRNGCYCPLHLDEIGRRLDRTFTRETLLNALRTDSATAHAYDKLLLDSLLLVAGIIRDAIDETDPIIPGSFCTCQGDIRHAVPITRVLAGKGNPLVIRINNARYLSPEMRTFANRMYDGAAQIAGLGPDVTLLAETDTCPQNRYSSGANLMHAQYTGSILEGCHGAKHWITRRRSFQPSSGVAYRAILTKYHAFYETLFNAVQNSAPSGYAAAVLPDTPFFNAAPDQGNGGSAAKTWGTLLSVLGLPCNFAKMPDFPAMMTGSEVDLFSDDDLKRLMKNGLILEGLAAEKLCRRGFSAELGIMAEPWKGPRVSFERWGQVNLGPDVYYSRLTPIDPKVKIHSMLRHAKSGVSTDSSEIGPAVTLFENQSGGRVASVAATFGLSNALSSFGFYDEDRKREILELIHFVCGKPVEFYYPGDAEVYIKVRRFADGPYLLAFFNLGHDELDVLPINSAFTIGRVEMIAPDGSWEPVDFANGCLQTPLFPAQPKVFRVTVKSPCAS
jgi:hypothetical protein